MIDSRALYGRTDARGGTRRAPHFTAINVFRHGGRNSRSAFTVNDRVGIYLKYARKPFGRWQEYQFTFDEAQMEELEALKKQRPRTYIALVCVKARHICCIQYRDLRTLAKARREFAGRDEEQLHVYVRLPRGKQFRVYVSPPGERGATLGEFKVPRNAFPEASTASSAPPRRSRQRHHAAAVEGLRPPAAASVAPRRAGRALDGGAAAAWRAPIGCVQEGRTRGGPLRTQPRRRAADNSNVSNYERWWCLGAECLWLTALARAAGRGRIAESFYVAGLVCTEGVQVRWRPRSVLLM
jgi:hypothetical protein